MTERTDAELAQLTRKHLKSIGTDWEILEPFLNRVLKPYEIMQVILAVYVYICISSIILMLILHRLRPPQNLTP
jgi:hypothetical protein